MSRTRPRLAAAVALLALGSASGCAGRPVRVRTAPATGSVWAEAGVQLGFAPKRVRGKEAPATLIAADGTVCRVAAERWERTKVGKAAACAWQLAPEPAP
jgi:hypothetical protein